MQTGWVALSWMNSCSAWCKVKFWAAKVHIHFWRGHGGIGRAAPDAAAGRSPVIAGRRNPGTLETLPRLKCPRRGQTKSQRDAVHQPGFMQTLISYCFVFYFQVNCRSEFSGHAKISRTTRALADGTSAPRPRADVLGRAGTCPRKRRRIDLAERRPGCHALQVGICRRHARRFALVR